MAAQKLHKPVAWISDRTDHFLSDCQGRDNYTVAEMALDREGRFLALKVDVLANMGSYLSIVAPYVPFLGMTMYPGSYRIPHAYVQAHGVFTHTQTVDAYRGAGRPEAAYLIERLVDAVARETGVAPDEVRRKNFIDKKEMPYETPSPGDDAERTLPNSSFDGPPGLSPQALHSRTPAHAGRLRGFVELHPPAGVPDLRVCEVPDQKPERFGLPERMRIRKSQQLGSGLPYCSVLSGDLSCPRKIEQAVTADTRVVMPVHLGGSAADLDTILEVAKRRFVRREPMSVEAIAADEAWFAGDWIDLNPQTWSTKVTGRPAPFPSPRCRPTACRCRSRSRSTRS